MRMDIKRNGINLNLTCEMGNEIQIARSTSSAACR